MPDKLTWHELDVSKLDGDDAKVVDAYNKARDAARVKQAALEAVLTKRLVAAGHVPAGMEPTFGYKWGKVSFAIRPVSSKSGTITV